MIKYNLSAVEILKKLGYDQPVGREMLETFKKRNKISLPKCYEEFMELAYKSPLLDNTNIWIDDDDLCFYYDDLSQLMLDFFVGYDIDPEEYKDDELYQLYRLPEKRWREKVPNFLFIGFNDDISNMDDDEYFCIDDKDLDKENPPVYVHHYSKASIMAWNKKYDALSDFLLEVVVNVLALTGYEEDVKEALGELNWKYTGGEECEDKEMEELLKEAGIDLDQIQKFSKSTDDSKTFCCYDEEEDTFYVGWLRKANGKNVLYKISK